MGLFTIVTQKSGNAKIGHTSATYQPTTHCVDCPLKDNGCFAQYGQVRFHVAPLEKRVREAHASPVRTAREEARGIDALKAKGQGLRLHVSGDCPSDETARIVSGAAERFERRGGGRAWSYTHAWRRVRRASWGAVSILASVETLADAKRAIRRGYATARVVPAFPSEKAWTEDNIRWIPCPAQTRDDVTCGSCRLCWDADGLRKRGAGIAFEAHSAGAKRAAAVVSSCRS